MTILGLAESFKTIIRPDPARTWRSLTAYFSESIKDREVKFVLNLHSNLEFVLSKFGIDIFDSLETMRFSETQQFR